MAKNEYEQAAFIALMQVICEDGKLSPVEAEENRILIALKAKGYHIIPIEDRIDALVAGLKDQLE